MADSEKQEFIKLLRENLGNGDVSDLIDEIKIHDFDNRYGAVDDDAAETFFKMIADSVFG